MSGWSKDKELIYSFFFEDSTEFILAVTVYMPILLLLAVLTITQSKNYRTIAGFGFLYGVAFWTISYNFTPIARLAFSRVNGFSPTPNGLSDWWFIPDLVWCRNASGCSRYGETTVYGNGWKVFSPLANDRVALILGGLMAGYVCYSIGKFSHRMKIPAATLMVFLCPSMVFSLERGQSDIFLIGLIFIFLSFKRVNSAIRVLVAILLLAMKPFFVVVFLRDRPKFLRILFLTPLFLLAYLWSMNFSFAQIRQARDFTFSFPKSTIGIDQLPSLVIQLIGKKFHINETVWQGAASFNLALIIGLMLFTVTYLSTLKYSFLHLQALKLDSIGVWERNVILIFASLYLLIYLSGSEVTYKAWVAFPVLILSLRRFIEMKERAKPSLLIFMSFILFGGFAIDIWSLRSIGTFVLAIYCAQIVTYFYRDSQQKFTLTAEELGSN